MSSLLIDPPVSYITALGIGIFIGAGVLLIKAGLFVFLQRTLKERRVPELRYLSIIALAFGILLTGVGIFLFLVLIVTVLTSKSPHLFLYINILLVVITAAFIIIPYFLMTRRLKNIN